MAYEAVEQMKGVKPTHVFLQAGVGAMSGAITGFFADLYKGDEKPVITIVEPNKADCIFRSAQANDEMCIRDRSIALALASGVGPEAGIFTAIVAGFVISALGGSCVPVSYTHLDVYKRQENRLLK